MTRPWLLSETNYGRVKADKPPAVAVLPLGATEPHNLHLPYGTDTIQVEELAGRACRRAYERGAAVVMLPALPYGPRRTRCTSPGDEPQPLHRRPRRRRPRRLARTHGVHKCLIVNGHGGNDLKWLLRELHRATPVHLFLCNWYKMAADAYPTIFEDAGDHAGELETSLVMALRPDLVALDQADPGATKPTRFEAVNKGWVEITRPWHLLTTNSGAGDPRRRPPRRA